MKQLIILFLILSNLQALRAQEYKPFNFDSGQWFSAYSKKGGMFGGGHVSSNYANDSVKFYCEGDTVINSAAFKKLMYVGNTRSMTVPLKPISGYYGAIRNDSLNKKVYFVSKSYDSSYTGTGDLLYDFDVTIGDSILTTCDWNYKEPINQIDSVLYCNEYHRRYTTTSGFYIIEGVGAQTGFIPHKCMLGIGYTFCYWEFGNQSCNACNFTLSLDEYNLERLRIFPNPANGSVQIVSDLNIRSVELYDVNGTLIGQLNYDNGFIKLEKKGFYILKIHTDSELIVRKITNE